MNPQEKNVKKNKSGLKNGVQQVYVLPPNLLQKLGINLGSVENSHILCPDLEQAKSNEINVSYNKYGSSSSHVLTPVNKSSHAVDETSIIQTASLMKQSVFLSPTFNNTASSFSNSPKNQSVEELNTNVENETLNSNTDITDNPINNLAEVVENSVYDKIKEKKDHNTLPKKYCDNKDQAVSLNKIKKSQLDCETVYSKKLPQNSSQNNYQLEDLSIKNENLQEACDIQTEKNKDPVGSLLTEEFYQTSKQVYPSTKNENLQTDCEKHNSNFSQDKDQVDSSTKNENLQDFEKEYFNKLPEKSSQNIDQREFSRDSENVQGNYQTSASTKHKQNESKNTINIISQTIITFSKLNELKAHIPSNTDLIPASLDTVIVKKRRNIIDPQTHSTISNETMADCNVVKFDKPSKSLMNDNVPMSVAPATYSNFVDRTQNTEFLGSNTQIARDSDINENRKFIPSINEQNSKKEHTSVEKTHFIITDDVIENDNNEILLQNVMDNTIHEASIKNVLENSETKRSFNNNTNSADNNNAGITKTVTNRYYKEVSPVPQDDGNIISYNKLKQLEIHDFTLSTNALDSPLLTSDLFLNNLKDAEKTKLTSENMFDTTKIQEDDRKQKEKSHKDIIEGLSDDNMVKSESKKNKNISNNSENQAQVVRKISDVNVLNNIFCDSNEIEHIVKTGPRTYSNIHSKKAGLKKPKYSRDVDNTDINMSINNVQNQSSPVQKVPENVKDVMEDLKLRKKCSLSVIRTNQNEGESLKMTLDLERKKLVSKLCIQGVEKPGGITVKERPIRTYINKRKCNLLGDSIVKRKCNLLGDFTVTTDIKSNFEWAFSNKHYPNYSEYIPNIYNFCVCKDFGTLADDTYDGYYEHVHFLQKRSLNCSSEVIFSMYNNDETLCYENSEENPTDSNNITEEALHYICWNHASSAQNNFDIDDKHGILQAEFESTENDEQGVSTYNETYIQCEEVKEESESVNENFMSDIGNETADYDLETQTRKRKISLDVTDAITKHKVVKCDLCKEMLKETNLEEHLANKHGFICLKGNNKTESNNNSNEDDTIVKCGVCNVDVRNINWLRHIADFHDYIAWKNGEKSLDIDNEEDMMEHLNSTLQQLGQLVCKTCKMAFKYSKPFLDHIGKCYRGLRKVVKCAVCRHNVEGYQWIKHIAKHNYLAWKSTEKKIDFSDAKVLREHLKKIVNAVGILICANCGFECQYARKFAAHIESCTKNVNVPAENDNIKCGVCKEEMTRDKWIEHIKDKHEYQAWKEGEAPPDFENELALHNHLYNILQKYGSLECAKCGMTRKYVKLYLKHVKSCTGPDPDETMNITEDWDALLDIPYADNTISGESKVTCGVCLKEIEPDGWVEHIKMEHNYVAWQLGRKPLDVEDAEVVRRYLHQVAQMLGSLECAKCGILRKYPKKYLQHIQSCTGPTETSINDDTSMPSERCRRSLDTNVSVTDVDDSTMNTSTDFPVLDDVQGVVRCDVCKQEMDSKLWVNHIKKEHKYIAWREGQKPVDLQDKVAVKQHLNDILQKVGQLVCAKCGTARKDVEFYLQHIESCSGEMSNNLNQDVFIKCGVCQKQVIESKWINHIEVNHEYIAWKDSETPLDVTNYDATKQHLMNIIKLVGALRCSHCKIKRKYPKAFLMHVKECYGKEYSFVSEEKCENSTLNDSRLSDVDTTVDESVAEEDGDGSESVKCGVCGEEMQARLWRHHIQQHHQYLAWREGATPIDLESETSIKDHLRRIMQKDGCLTCAKCGLVRKKVLLFYRHAKSCDGTVPVETNTVERDFKSKGEIVKCAVCQAELEDSAWIAHIAKEHHYLAWREGEEPLAVNDDMLVRDYLNKIINYTGELICNKCGSTRKYARSYLTHMRSCTGAEEDANDTANEPVPKKLTGVMVTCGLCHQEMDDALWMDHIKEHNYVAWKKDEPPLDFEDEKAVKDYLYSVMEQIGQLVCSKCGTVRKYVKSYLQHLEICKRVTWETIKRCTIKVKKEKGDIVKCAVCLTELDDTEWISHIAEHHNYLAWRDRDPAINLEDQDEVRSHLKKIIQEEGYLQCAKCGVQRKYPKIYLSHVNDCDGTSVETDAAEVSYRESAIFDDMDDSDVQSVKCGVCQQEVLKAQWIEHIQKEHKYLAWQDGKTPIDVDDKEVVYNHLYAISHKCNGLVCGECGLVRKYVKPYLSHIKSCSGKAVYNSDEIYECGVCGQKVVGKSWRSHAMSEHYNIAWLAGSAPIEIRNYSEVERCLKELYEYKHRLVCHNCDTSRSSVVGFYAHILTCGKTDEEIDQVKDLCEICNQKFLFIYKTQHYRAHRTQELMKERKIMAEQKKLEEVQEVVTLGPRRAAEKAKNVIGDYTAKLSSSNIYRCPSCGFEAESIDDLPKHYCPKRPIKSEDEDDFDDSVNMNNDLLSESEVDSDVSNEHIHVAKRKICNIDGKYAAKTSKLPFTVKDVKSYLEEAANDFFKLLYTSETLFPQWRACTYEKVSEDLLSQYIPPLEESCKVRIGKDTWTTFKRFESMRNKDYSAVFTGACIQCMAWAPAGAGGAGGVGGAAGGVGGAAGGTGGVTSRSVVGVAVHGGGDCPRRPPAHTAQHPALIQLWDFGHFSEKPKLAYGIAHDYGTVWALDWCPSGARDVWNGENVEDDARPRLGLMAIACSNGSAYVLSIPYPDNNSSETIFCKIKPCVELRITRGTNKYQATSIHWSLEKGYTTILVGYGDGTTAMFDLDTKSPLLMSKDGDTTVLYPFHEDRTHNSCVTGLTSSIEGAWCSTSPTGATGALGRPAGGAGGERGEGAAGGEGAAAAAGGGVRPRALRVHTPLAASAGLFTPHWPSVLLAGDDTIVGQAVSEVEWGASGRRSGAVRAAAACPRRALALAAHPPLLLALRLHPAYAHAALHKKAVAIINMSPLAKKRSKHTNDELSMKVEPLTYEDAIKFYGIEFILEKDLEKRKVQKLLSGGGESRPERFPLGDVPALALCPAPARHAKLALATHAGFIFLIDT